MLACAKHFAGDGGTTYGTGMKREAGRATPSTGATRASPRPSCDASTCRATARRSPAGVGSIMPSYSSWNGEKASGSKRLLTDILKGELGFEGLVISDYNAIDELPGDYRSQIKHVDQRGHGHVHGPREVPGVHRGT